MPLKIDLHVHTNCSADSLITPEELVFYAKKCGLDGVAIVDHERFDGALKIAKTTDLLIIPGMEIESLDGHIIGLNVKENVPKKLHAGETIDKIHEAGGIAIACHPVSFFKGGVGKHTDAKFDAVEVINSSAFPFRYSVRHGRTLATRLGASAVAGSDAHYGPEIGYAYTTVNAEPKIDAIVSAIKKGSCEPFGKAIPLFMRLKKEILMQGRRF